MSCSRDILRKSFWKKKTFFIAYSFILTLLNSKGLAPKDYHEFKVWKLRYRLNTLAYHIIAILLYIDQRNHPKRRRIFDGDWIYESEMLWRREIYSFGTTGSTFLLTEAAKNSVRIEMERFTLKNWYCECTHSFPSTITENGSRLSKYL